MQTWIDQASSVMTVVSFITFVGILLWAYSKKQRDAFNEAAHIPFQDEEVGLAKKESP